MTLLRLGFATLLVAAAALASTLLVARTAEAQVHWDAHVNGGVAKRFLSGGDLSGGFGPIVGLDAHVAVIPLLRVGAYVDHEVAPTGEPTSRQITTFGLRLKVTPPLRAGDLRGWVFAGLGYALVNAPSYHQAIPMEVAGQVTPTDTLALPATGHFVEIPFGVGAGWTLRKPLELIAELSGRIGLGAGGSYYDDTGRPGTVLANGLPVGLGPIGGDAFALVLTLGIGFDL